MAERSGFYASTTTNPRKYGNTDMNMVFARLISNGVFATPQGTPSNQLQVMANDGLEVTIKSGIGYFANKWYENTTDLVKSIVQGSVVDRTDYVVVRADENENEKRTYVLVKTGNTTTGVAPSLIDDGTIKEYLLAKIHVPALAVSITQDMIEDCRGTAECPWVTSIVQQVDTSTLWLQFKTAFDTWFSNLRENLTTTVMITQKTAQVLTTSANQSIISIPESVYFNINLDVLNVFIEGRKLIQDVDYTKANNSITLTLPLPVSGTKIEFEVIKNIEASDVEQYVDRLYALETIVGNSKITNNNGGVRITVTSTEDLLVKIKNEGIGTYTFYSEIGATNNPKSTYTWRGLAIMSATNAGCVYAISYNRDVYVNTLYNDVWSGWRMIYESEPKPLWTGIYYPTASQTATPSKKLSECRTGWTLVWSGYDSGGVTEDYVTTYIPKTDAAGNAWNNKLHYAMIATAVTADSVDANNFVIKGFYVSNDKIVGIAANNAGNRTKAVLRAIYEY